MRPSDPGSQAQVPLAPTFHVKQGDPVVRPALGLTAYLADPRVWANQGAARALSLFLEFAPRAQLGFSATSSMSSWRPLSQAQLPKIVEVLTLQPEPRAPRHQFRFSLVDLPNVPEVGFSYTEVDPQRATRAAVLELTLPCSSDPELLVVLARQLATIGPLFSVVGGNVIRWSPLFRKLAFNQIYLWARRFVGFDVQVAEEMAWRASEAAPGTNWLTLLGEPLQEVTGLNLEALRQVDPSVQLEELPGGVLLRAGNVPSWGDLNAFEWPSAYASLAQAIAAALPAAPPPFWGAFYPDDGTLRWHRRFLEPAKWVEP